MTDDYLREELRKAIATSGPKPIVICGAGVSMQATDGKAPGWGALIESGIGRVANLDASAKTWAGKAAAKIKKNDPKVWIKVANELTQRLGGAHNSEFRTWLYDQVGQLRPTKRDLIEALLGWGCPIATTNYDEILQRATGRPVVLWSDHAGTADWLAGRTDAILHLHGHWATPASVILGSESYARHSGDERRKLLQQFMALGRPTVFVGCSDSGLNDPDFAQLAAFVTEWPDVAERRYWLIKHDATTGAPPGAQLDDRLFPISFGSTNDDLPIFLRALAPASAGLRRIDRDVERPSIFGRDDEMEAVIAAVTAHGTALIAGGPGMGKTTLAVAALYDERIRAAFAERRVFISLEPAAEPRELLSRLADGFGLSATGGTDALLEEIEAFAKAKPVAAILDNAESVFERNHREAERLLRLLAQISNLALVVTIRGDAPTVSGATVISDLPKLDEPAARTAFLDVAGDRFSSDPALPKLLSVLEGHALSINLLGARAKSEATLLGLVERWNAAHAGLLKHPIHGEARLTSVSASLRLSMESPRMMGSPDARRLVGILAQLPAGLAAGDVSILLGGDLAPAQAEDVADCLRQLHLVERRPDRRLRMLTPLRECAKLEVPLEESDLGRVVSHFLAIATDAGRIGTNTWEKVRASVETEADNLDPLILLALQKGPVDNILEDALDGLGLYHSSSGRAGVSSLAVAHKILETQHNPAAIAGSFFRLAISAPSSLDGNKKALFEKALNKYKKINDISGEAYCLINIGHLYRASNLDAARANYEQAKLLFKQLGNADGEAACITSLANVARVIARHQDAINFYEEAKSLYQKIGQKKGEADCLFGLADIARTQGNLTVSKNLYEQARLIFLHSGLSVGEANATFCLGELARLNSEYDAAETLIAQAMNIYQRVDDALGTGNCQFVLGEIALSRRNCDEARNYYIAATTFYQRVGGVLGEAHCLKGLGDIALILSQKDDAYALYEQAKYILSNFGNPIAEAECLMSLGEIDESRGDIGKARLAFETAVKLYASAGLLDEEASARARIEELD
ncbi:MAG: tetratricopeptide repeat protein [Proteobacteria bacterium]|nr:tetratricopeptide repeat protein [Pseudomonadota bacterium]